MCLSLRAGLLVLLVVVMAACATATATPSPMEVSPEVFAEQTATLIPSTAIPTQSVPTERPLPRTIADVPEQQSYLRFVHAAPDVGLTSFDIGGLTLAAGLAYEQFTQATPIVAGSYTVRVISAGARADELDLLQQEIVLQPGQTLLVVLVGSTESALSLAVFAEDTQPLSGDRGAIRLLNALTGEVSALLSAASEPVSEPVTSLDVSAPTALDAGDIEVTISAGDDAELTFVQRIRPLRRYTLVLVGQAVDASTWQVIALDTRVPAEASLRVSHAAPEVGAVDIYLGDRLLVAGLTSYAVSERQVVAGRSQVLHVYSTGTVPDESIPIFTEQIIINPDEARTVILTGTLANLRFVNVQEDLSSLEADQTRVIFVHVAPDVRRIEYGLPRTEAVIPPLDYLQSSSPFDLNAGEFDLVFIRADGDAASVDVELATGIHFEAGRSYLYLITGRDEDMPPVVYGDDVGFVSMDEAVIGADRLNEDEAENVGIARMRVVNAVDASQGVDFVVNDSVIAQSMSFGESGVSFVLLTEGEHTLTLRDSESGDDLYSELFMFVPDTDYSVYAFGFADEGLYGISQVEDTSILASPMNAVIRLVNLSLDSYQTFGLGFMPSVGGEVAQPFVREDGTIGRPSLFAEVNRIIGPVDGGDVSNSVAIVPGNLEFYVIEAEANVLALGLGPVLLEAGHVYDVVVYQYTDSMLLNGFVVQYPDV